MSRRVFREHHPVPSESHATKWMARRLDDESVEHGRWQRVYHDGMHHYVISSNPRGRRDYIDGVPSQ